MTLYELYELAKAENVDVFDFLLNKRESLSMMDSDGECYIAIDPRSVISGADEKTKLAHELGHCITGAFYNVYSTYDIRQRHENRADKWAIKKLIPEDELNAAVIDGHTEIWELAEYFSVTEEFMRKVVSWYKFGNLHSI